MTAQTLTLAAFLLERFAEDERHARKLAETDKRPVLSLALTVNHPQRILLECEAKRRIVERAQRVMFRDDRSPHDDRDFGFVLAALALPYADHADFNPDWRP